MVVYMIDSKGFHTVVNIKSDWKITQDKLSHKRLTSMSFRPDIPRKLSDATLMQVFPQTVMYFPIFLHMQ